MPLITPLKTAIYQTKQIRELEHLAKERLNLNGHTLMQRAGIASFDFLIRRFPKAQKIAVFCGSGNNGGDGYVVAKLAKHHGLAVTLWQVGNQDNLKEEAREALRACREANIPCHPIVENMSFPHPDNYPDVIIDAICGIGLHDTLRPPLLHAIKKIEEAHVPILAIDIPTGIDADTGRVLGAAVSATATITFIGLKLGLLTGSGVSHTGELMTHDLLLPAELFAAVKPVAEKIHLHSFSNYLKPRPRDWHKGLSGRVLIIGGDLGFSGAPQMAGRAALRVGAGLVTIATHPDNAVMMNVTCPELMCHGIKTPNQLKPLIAKTDVIVIGPGLGQTTWGEKIWNAVYEEQHLPLVIDADGLNFLAALHSEKKKGTPERNWVLTPHPGEAARLLGTHTQTVQNDRLAASFAMQKRYGGVCILKGAGSLVVSPQSLPIVCDKGNPGMSSPGMGDILSGVIGGFIAQGVPLADAAGLSVYLHAMAGDLSAKEGERGMIATDLLPYLRYLSNAFAENYHNLT